MPFRRGLAACLAAAVVMSSAVFAQRNNQQPQRSKAEQADLVALSNAVDLAAAGQAANDIPITWDRNHFMRAADLTGILAFEATVDKSALSGKDIAIYIRLMDKAQIDKISELAKLPEKDRANAAKAAGPLNYPVQALLFSELPADGKLSRRISVPPGEYDLFLAVKDKAKDEKAKPGKIGILRKSIVVPDYDGSLTTSDVIVADKVEEMAQPLPQNKLDENPYVFGPYRFQPTSSNKFAKTGELNVVFWVYDAGVSPATGKPDVQVEYNFYTKAADGEKFFNKMMPVVLNATTLPADFDYAKTGKQMTQLQSVGLMPFPPGDYRLEIKVTDKTNNKTVTRNVNFNVA
jgi:hypothetical protein